MKSTFTPVQRSEEEREQAQAKTHHPAAPECNSGPQQAQDGGQETRPVLSGNCVVLDGVLHRREGQGVHGREAQSHPDLFKPALPTQTNTRQEHNTRVHTGCDRMVEFTSSNLLATFRLCVLPICLLSLFIFSSFLDP